MSNSLRERPEVLGENTVLESIKRQEFENAKRRVELAQRIGKLLKGEINGNERSAFLKTIDFQRRKRELIEGPKDIETKDYQVQTVNITHTSPSGESITESFVSFARFGKGGKIELLERNGEPLAFHQKIYEGRMSVPPSDRYPDPDTNIFALPVIDKFGYGIKEIVTIRQPVKLRSATQILTAPNISGNGHIRK